jgi:hypothetical protein
MTNRVNWFEISAPQRLMLFFCQVSTTGKFFVHGQFNVYTVQVHHVLVGRPGPIRFGIFIRIAWLHCLVVCSSGFFFSTTTKLQLFPDGRKPTGKPKKPSGIQFLMAGRQETADTNDSTGEMHFSWRTAVRKQFLTAVPDGLGLAGQDQLLSVQPSGNPVRRNTLTGILHLSRHSKPSGTNCVPDLSHITTNITHIFVHYTSTNHIRHSLWHMITTI